MNLNVPPDCTLTTSCFDLTRFHADARPLAEAIDSMRTLLEIPCFLVIYTDTLCLPHIQHLRAPLNHYTVYVVQPFETTPYYPYLEKVKGNRAVSWPTRDVRTCAEGHILVCSKHMFVLQTMESNPFRTSRFGWIDANLGINCSKIAENFTPDMLLQCLRHANEKFHIQILNVNDKKYLDAEHKPEFYQQYRWVMCGCFFTTGTRVGRRIFLRMDELFRTATEQGFGHGEEMLYLEILEEFYDDIERSYGDYGQILNNYFCPTRNLRYVHDQILKRFLNYGYYREALHCAQQVLAAIETNLSSCPPDLHFSFLFSSYLATYYTDRTNAQSAVDRLYKACHSNSALLTELNKNRHFYEQQFVFAL